MYFRTYTFLLCLSMAMEASSTPTPRQQAAAVIRDVATAGNVSPLGVRAQETKIPVTSPNVPKATACPTNNNAAQALADGIDANIAVQKEEASSLAKIKSIESKNPVDTNAFNQAKTHLVATVNKGIKVREKNQKIAPAGNKAIPGLATVSVHCYLIHNEIP
jgi:hypothetical protein